MAYVCCAILFTGMSSLIALAVAQEDQGIPRPPQIIATEGVGPTLWRYAGPNQCAGSDVAGHTAEAAVASENACARYCAGYAEATAFQLYRTPDLEFPLKCSCEAKCESAPDATQRSEVYKIVKMRKQHKAVSGANVQNSKEQQPTSTPQPTPTTAYLVATDAPKGR